MSVRITVNDLGVYAKSAIALTAIFTVLAFLWVYASERRPSLTTIRLYRVSVTPLVSDLDTVGNIQPAAVTLVVAPFEGYVKAKYADDGAIVHAGGPSRRNGDDRARHAVARG